MDKYITLTGGVAFTNNQPKQIIVLCRNMLAYLYFK